MIISNGEGVQLFMWLPKCFVTLAIDSTKTKLKWIVIVNLVKLKKKITFNQSSENCVIFSAKVYCNIFIL